LSTPDLVRAIAAALHVEPRIASVPVPLLRLAGALCGRRDAIARLTGSLEVDTSSLIAATGWRPRPFAIDGI
jgi:UDP-glucose 4-epimerase